MKVVTKPWGKEIWIELNDKYCFKQVFLNEGFRTSYQFHRVKTETNFIVEGKAIVFLENNVGEIKRHELEAGDFFTVPPMIKHRVAAVTNLVMMEVSTPEVDDVVRLEDDSHRGNGRINSELA